VDFPPNTHVTGVARSMRKTRRNQSAALNFRVTLKAIRGEKRAAQPAAQRQAHLNQVTRYKTELLENPAEIFGGHVLAAPGTERIRQLHANIAESTVERHFLKRRSRELPRPGRQAMIDRAANVPVKRRAQLLDLNRSSVNCGPRLLPNTDFELMRRSGLRSIRICTRAW
jgi:transposase